MQTLIVEISDLAKSQVTRRLALFDRLQPDLQRGPSVTLTRNASPRQLRSTNVISLQT